MLRKVNIYANRIVDEVAITYEGQFNYTVLAIAGKVIQSGFDQVEFSVLNEAAEKYVIQSNGITQYANIIKS